jgi:Leucine-rich repeat (LRR) protein
MLRTCSVKNQAINYIGFKIASPKDLSVKGFSIKSNVDVQFLPENLSKSFPNLIGVEVWNCSVRFVSLSHLRGLTSLNLLDLSFNNIEKIDNGAFDDNSKLTKLILSYNQIKHLSEKLFNSLHDLTTLHLSHNKIHFIDSKTFKNLKNIHIITLNHNQLESIEKNMLINNKKLDWIWLDHNKIKMIDYRMFEGIKSLTEVDLEGNLCISGKYFENTFKIMKTELKENCTSV